MMRAWKMRVWSRGFQRRFRKSLSDRLLVTVIAPCIFASFAWASLAWAQESSHSAGWVVISVEDYRVLRAKAYPACERNGCVWLKSVSAPTPADVE